MDDPIGRSTAMLKFPLPFAPDVQFQTKLAESKFVENELVTIAPFTPEGLRAELEITIVYFIGALAS
jgi:hypothetical protein